VSGLLSVPYFSLYRVQKTLFHTDLVLCTESTPCVQKYCKGHLIGSNEGKAVFNFHKNCLNVAAQLQVLELREHVAARVV
jgi:hypothetical protein